MPLDVHKELSSTMLVPDSETMAKIWEILCDENDARLLLSMPSTVEEMKEKTGLPEEEITARLKDLFVKGVVFEWEKPEGTVYRAPKNLIQFHDASVQWPDAPQQFYDLWKSFMDNEFPAVLKMWMTLNLPSFMRTIPASGTIDHIPDKLDYEDVQQMIRDAKVLSVVRCPCRLSNQNCDAELETCIQLDRSAEYNIKRGTGRRIDTEEALQIVRDAEDAGLVHMVENKAGQTKYLCNCCNDCCVMMVPYLKGGEYSNMLAMSRFVAFVIPDMCSQDEVCVNSCPVDMITMDGEGGAALVDSNGCMGCGLCVKACPTGALTLTKIREPDFIAST